MGFGLVGTTAISKSVNHSVQVAEQLNPQGDIVDMHAYGGATETTEEVYVDADTFTNLAVNGQGGTSIISAHSLTESNTDYCRASKTTRAALAVATTTT